ncbi:hypothetical protein K1T71_008042 [Dendrolimus kikuchii]|uniref:Uncharacterized protein n=1 Tax=Dendrolimus kikuchii TaxID=765133 RepID=A0ACC1CZW2_9NEOP|nr:hypothetical protein K1T71_008042 [Dendrolimus kikuchii]
MTKKFYYNLIVITSLLNVIVTQKPTTVTVTSLSEYATLNFTQIATKCGHKSEEHKIITSDGYILKTFRIIGDTAKPVLLNHGIFDTADGFIIRGNKSLAITLANEGYDVWLMNVRGNRYSREHLTLNPNNNRSFWEYSVHEFGFYDLPANIDYILQTTRQRKLSLIGFSQGTASTFVLGATRPEYNSKIKIFIALAPICHLQSTEGILKTLIESTPFIGSMFDILHIDEVMGYNSTSKTFLNIICKQLMISYDICFNAGLAQLIGEDPEETEKEFSSVIIGHFPAGTSRKTLVHFGQIGYNKRFAAYDYGILKNIEVYRSISSPEYDLNNVSMPTVLVVGRNDRISTLKDVELLKSKLKCVKSEFIVESEKFNHLDHIWARSSYKLSYPLILSQLTKNYD